MQDFIPDNQMPDFIPDAEANKYFSEEKKTQQKYEGAPLVAGSPIGKIPIIGGMAKSVESYGRMLGGTGYEGARAIASLLGDKNAYNSEIHQNPFLSEQDLTKFQSPAEGVGRTLGVMGTAATLYNPLATGKTVASAVKTILRKPGDTLGEIRGYFLDKSPIVADNMYGLKQKLAKDIFFKNASGMSQREARSALSRLLQNVAGGESSTVSLREVYKNLHALELLGKAYGKGGDVGSGALAQGTNITSHIVREFAKNESPIIARGLTDLMRALYAISDKAPGLLKGAGITGAVLYGINELKNTLSGNTESPNSYLR